MAQVSSGSFTTNASEGRSLKFSWSVDSTSISENYKKIYWSLVGSGGASGYIRAGDFKVVIDGETVYNSSTRIDLYNGTVVASGYKKLYHNTAGNKTFSASVQASIYEFAVDNTGSGTWELPTIPRYATSVQSLKSKTETSISMNWSSDSTVDYIWHSKDNGSTWTGINVTDGKSGSYTISGLSANTTYKIKTRVRRKDSQLTTDSSALSVTTYNYPYCTSAPNFTIGNAVTIGFYNPLKRTFEWEILGADGSRIGGISNETGTSYKGINGSTSVANLYKSIPNAKSGTYKVKVVYGTSTITKTGGTYSIKGTETPTVSTLSYADINATVTDITGNNQHIVQNKSNLRVTFGKATAKNSASISKYTFVLNGVTKTSTSAGGTVDFGTINSAKNLTLTMTVTDSRGLTAKTTKTITMVAYSTPTAIVTLNRLNNYEDETYLTVDGSVASVNSKNTMAIKYRYKASGGSYNSFVTIGDKVKQTLSLDKNKSYIFNVVVTDAFGSTYNKEHALGKGVFPLFIDTALNSVGINCLPTKEKSLEIAGSIFLNGGSLHPVGSVITTSTNTNPATQLGGTWKLIDREFKSAYLTDQNTGSTFTKASGISAYEITTVHSGHSIRIRLAFTPTNAINSDDEISIGTLKFDNLGVTDFGYSIISVPATSDIANGMAIASVMENGTVLVNDYIKPTTAGSYLYINATISLHYATMLDSFCNKFYWERTA